MLLFLFTASADGESQEKVLYSFQGIPDSATPVGSVVFDISGNIYGATTNGGSSSCISIVQCGTVYQLRQNGGIWTENVLYVFQGSAKNDGASPLGGLVMDGSGNLYGTTGYGGTGDCVLLGSKVGCGAVFKLSPPNKKGASWKETVLYSFPSSKYGYVPWGDLVFDSDGNLYGATMFGGGKGTTCDPFYQYCGAVFELSPPKKKGGAWTEKVLRAFKGITGGQQNGDGAEPNGGLVLDNKGAIYGTTQLGGYNCPHGSSQGCGTAFKLAPRSNKGGAWKETILHSFGGVADGATPVAGMTFDKNGELYGTTIHGGGGNFPSGTVFRLLSRRNGTWSEQILHSFQDGNDGGLPSASVVLDEKGNVYGTVTGGGGAFRYGVLFRLEPGGGGPWNLIPFYAFTGSPDGAHPAAPLVMDKAGNWYSTTQWGGTGTNCYGTGGCGTVFEASP